MLPKQLVPIPFRGGVDLKSNPKLVAEGKLTILENGVFKQTGINPDGSRIISIVKRNGYEKIGDTVADSVALNTFKDELLVFDNNEVQAYVESTDTLQSKGGASSVPVSYENIVRNNREQSRYDIAVVGGVTVYIYQDASGVRATVKDSSGALIQADTLLSATAVFPKLVVIGTKIFAIYVDGTTYKQRLLDSSDPTTFDAEVTIASDVHATTKFHDVAAVSSSRAVFVYRNTGGDIKLAYLTNTGVEGNNLNGNPNAVTIAETPSACLTVFVEPTAFNIGIAWGAATGCRATVYASNFVAVHAPFAVDATAAVLENATGVWTAPTTFDLFVQINAAATYNRYVKLARVSGATVSSYADFQRSVGLASKAFLSNSTTHVVVVHDSTLQATYFLARATSGVSRATIVSKVFAGLAYGLTNSATLPQVVGGLVPLGIKTRLVSENDNVFSLKGVAAVTFDFDSNSRFFSAEIGDNLILAGGIMQDYDGQGFVEHGFHLYPENIGLTSSGTGGSMAVGTYQVVVVWEWTDAQGQIHRSAPSVPSSITISSGAPTHKLTVTVPTLRITQKTSPRPEVSIVAYRTENLGTVFYRATSITSPQLNSTTTDSVSFDLTISDSTLIAGEILYTDGGTLPNDAPGSAQLITASKNRVFYVGEDGLSVYYSRAQKDGEGLAFSGFLFKRVDPRGGDVKAIAAMDDKVVIWKDTSLFFFSGDGPNDTGAQDSFTEPQLIQGDVGVEDANAIAPFPGGLIFKSKRGFYQLSRNLELSYIGADVEELNTANFVSGETVPDTNEVRFLTSDNVAAVYDYYAQAWTTFTNHAGLDAVVWKKQYVYLKSTGDIFLEAPGVYTDDGVAVRLKIATAWIKLAGVQGFQRIKRLFVVGDFFSDHILRVSVGYDYEAYFQSAYDFNAAEVMASTTYGDDETYGDDVYGGSSETVYQFRVHLEKQKCESIRFQFEDVLSVTIGQSFTLTELAVEAGAKQGGMKLGESKTL